ncbi:hypothetical protein ACIRPU_11150 [Streptomyces sp. NPDC102259]|uniref:hypothetical protein n=1 Tax=Streptomyces sp. NPDC102259 TaxID=3366148 RepID=UPI00380ABDD9
MGVAGHCASPGGFHTDDGKKIGSFAVHRPPRRVLLLHVCLMLLAAHLTNTLPWAAASEWIIWSVLAAAVLRTTSAGSSDQEGSGRSCPGPTRRVLRMDVCPDATGFETSPRGRSRRPVGASYDRAADDFTMGRPDGMLFCSDGLSSSKE